MGDVAVVTDSTASLPAALVDSLGITLVSLYYDVDGSQSPEGGQPGLGDACA
jgi:fatty acid-binding protein DegV